MLEMMWSIVEATSWAVPRGPWWDLALLLVSLTKVAFFAIPIFCAYQMYRLHEAGNSESTEFYLWLLGACVTGGGCIGWAAA